MLTRKKHWVPWGILVIVSTVLIVYNNAHTNPSRIRSVQTPGATALQLQSQHNTQGSQPYIPTRLEWLMVQLNARNTTNGTIAYTITNPNTIRVIVFTKPIFTYTLKQQYMNLGKKQARDLATYYGWNLWLRLEEQFVPVSD